MAIRKCVVKLELDKDDDMSWENHQIPGLRKLHLDSGPQTIVGREPRLRRSVTGVYIFSTWISQYEHNVTLKSRRKNQRQYEDTATISPCKGWFTFEPRLHLGGDGEEYESTIAMELRQQVRGQVRTALESRSIHGISDRDMDRWITVSREVLPDTGYIRITATSRPLPVAMVRSANQ